MARLRSLPKRQQSSISDTSPENSPEREPVSVQESQPARSELQVQQVRNAGTNTVENDEDTLDFFYKPHTISVLVLMLSFFLYIALYVTEDADSVRNTKVGLGAAAMVLVLLGLLMFPDGPFIRPHPALWRIVTASSAVYLILLVFLLFQNKHDAREILRYFDSSLGIKLPERSYATNCDLTWDNVADQMDEFVIAHALGWFAKGLMLRDYWIGWILSVMFEVLEYSLQHQLPNFAECWWDHWILDVLVCNWLGLWAGMKICHYLDIKTYSWRGIRAIPTYSGKVKRAVQQFTPYSWTKFEWAYTKDFKHFSMVVMIVVLFLQGELNAFYLKYLLWIPPPHPINPLRLFLMFLLGTAAIREAYQYLTDNQCKKLGANAWLTIAVVMTETLICIKYGRNEFHEPTPHHVIVFWVLFVGVISLYAVLHFVVEPYYENKGKTISAPGSVAGSATPSPTKPRVKSQ